MRLTLAGALRTGTKQIFQKPSMKVGSLNHMEILLLFLGTFLNEGLLELSWAAEPRLVRARHLFATFWRLLLSKGFSMGPYLEVRGTFNIPGSIAVAMTHL